MKLLAQATPVIDFNNLRGSAFPTPGEINLMNSDLTLGEIITQALTYVYLFAGLILLFFLIKGGFQMMLGAADPKAKESASKTVTNALIGFFILFVSYWLVQIIEVVLGISILK